MIYSRHFFACLLAFGGTFSLSPLPAQGASALQLPGAVPDLSRTADGKWKVNDRARPQPERAAPKSEAELAVSARAPADAIVLFDGKDLSQWQPTEWKLQDGYVEEKPRAGNLVSKAGFGSCRLHVEWWTPNPPARKLQMRGNSGVFLMSRYEVQVLDTYDNSTYADGFAGAIYGQSPPSVNPIRPPGQWQSYDIEFHRPIFSADGKLTKPATITVGFNGVRVQDHFTIEGATTHGRRHGYDVHPDSQPLALQEHGCIVRFRNIWIEPISD